MQVKRRQNLAEADRRLYCKEERLEKFLGSKCAFYSGNESDNDDRVIRKIINSSSYWRVLPIVAKNSYTNSSTKTR